MGKKARRTKWRTLTIADEHSDSEESNTTTASRLPKSYQQKSYYNKFPYSSQSTPRRRYQHDGAKSTRSSSTASETKITFNEDEYTRITTPRQDVLFKKGYLNKPKNYQTQTSTGTSTTSTGNSTGNGTPDHQSTDLEYESQFLFPNGFLDQNGIYYVNSYDSYPLMLYNPPTYYPEFTNGKSKRYSTGSLTESTSPNNEEATSQDLSGGEASNNVSDYSGHHHVYNMVYPGYYVNEVCSTESKNGQCFPDQSRRIKKRRRRKTSRTQTTTQNSSEYSEDESDSYIEADNHESNNVPDKTQTDESVNIVGDDSEIHKNHLEPEISVPGSPIVEKSETIAEPSAETAEFIENVSDIAESAEVDVEKADIVIDNSSVVAEYSPTKENDTSSSSPKPQRYDLKPDAEEFVPRAYRSSEIPLSPVQFINVPPNFVPIPIVPFNGQNFNPAFISSGIPVNFLPPDPKMFPNFVGFVSTPPTKTEVVTTRNEEIKIAQVVPNDQYEVSVKTCDNSSTAKDDNAKADHPPQSKIPTNPGKSIDIATIVSKLEEAAKEQKEENIISPVKDINKAVRSPNRNSFVKQVRSNQKFKNNSNYRKMHYNSVQNSPEKQIYPQNNDVSHQAVYNKNVNVQNRKAPEHSTVCDTVNTPEGRRENKKLVRNSPEKFRKNWKQNYQNGNTKWHPNYIDKSPELRQKPFFKTSENNDKLNPTDRHYSETLKNSSPNSVLLVKNADQTNVDKLTDEFSSKPPLKSGNESLSTKLPNQWISVASRKKRKNKSLEDTDAVYFEDNLEDDHSVENEFESYDVSLLVDVIPSTKCEEEIISVEVAAEKVEEIINTIARTECTAVENNILTPEIRSVTEIESELITLEPEVIEEVLISPKPVEEIVNSPDIPNEESDVTAASKSNIKKKSKKGTQKPLTRRVIITDLDLSEECEKIKLPIKKIVKKIEKPIDKLDLIKPEEPIIVIEAIKEVQQDEIKVNEEDEKKRGKKKKKKLNKVITSDSLSSSSATLNLADDSYDFLLDSTLVDESEDKTNDEVSQELDKIIQKGMYSSLEEKIKSLNIDESDGFFKSVFSKISSRESSVEKTGFTKTPDFTKILQNTRSMFKPSSVSQEIVDLQNKTTNKILPDLDSSVEEGIFLENPAITKILKDQATTQTQQTAISIIEVEDAPKALYPITEAVKEWMCRTRETTPDVEILKTPTMIYEEFCDSGSDSETEIPSCISKNLSDELSVCIEDDEITVFVADTAVKSRDTSEEKQDILEYWEDDVGQKIVEEGANSVEVYSGDKLEAVERGEEMLEVYESKYGKNEDFLNLQMEIREKTQGSIQSKETGLPHRAICCSVM